MSDFPIKNNGFESRTLVINLRPDGILHFVAKPGAHETVEDARRELNTAKVLVGGIRRPSLADMRETRSMDRGARLLYSGEASAAISLAVALLVGSPTSRIIGNFFLGFNKPLIPTRLFSSEDEATRWLLTFIPQKAPEAEKGA